MDNHLTSEQKFWDPQHPIHRNCPMDKIITPANFVQKILRNILSKGHLILWNIDPSIFVPGQFVLGRPIIPKASRH